MRRSKQAIMALAISGVAITACAVLITILANRDSSGVTDAQGVGTVEPDRGDRHVSTPAAASAPDAPPTSGPHRPMAVTRDAATLTDDQLLEALHLGNVVLAYGDDTPPAALERLQEEVSGPFDPELAAAGQAVILDHRPGVDGVLALAWRHVLRTDDPADPELRAFADARLGQG